MSSSSLFTWFLRVAAVFFVLVSLLHLVFGLAADASLGAQVSATTLMDPGLDSQNRFYGVCLSMFAAVFWLTASDTERYFPVFRCALVIFFCAGLARFVSVAMFGWPPTMICVLFAVELLLPPLLWFWSTHTRTIANE